MVKRAIGADTILKARAAGGSIRLMHPRWTDFEDWTALRLDNQTYLRPWEPDWQPEHLSRTAYRKRLATFKKLVANARAYPFHIIRDQPETLIGACNITHIERGAAQSAKLGYWVGQAYARNGFARAAVSASTDFCFDKLNLHRVEAAVQADNIASIKVLEAVGFQPEGTARGMLKINGRWADHVIYAKLRSD